MKKLIMFLVLAITLISCAYAYSPAYVDSDIASVTIDSLIRIFLVVGSLITIIIIFIGGLHIMKVLGLRKQ
jgi:hypothetical protein